MALGNTCGYLIVYPYPGAVIRNFIVSLLITLHGTLLGTPLGLMFIFNTNRYYSSFRHLTDRHMDCYYYGSTCVGVGISCAPTSGAVIESKIKSIKYFQLLEFSTLSISPAWLVPYSRGRCRTAKLVSIN